MDETTPPASDAELLRRHAVARDEAAFAELVRRHLALVYFSALRQVGGDAHRAEDVAQVVFARLAQKAPALARHPALAGWLHTATRFAASEAMRSERRRSAREHEAHAMNELHPAPDPAAHADWDRLRPVIDQALGDLGEADREAVLLRFFAGLPLAQVGARLNVSENAARMRVERALGKLQGLLEKRGVTSTGAALGLALGSQAALAAPAGLAASVMSAALAGTAATGGAATAAGVFGFMSMAKIMTGVAVVVGTIGVGVALHKDGEARRVARELAVAADARDAAHARIAALEKRAGEAEQGMAASTARAAALEKQLEAGRQQPTTMQRVAIPASGAAMSSARPSADDPAAQQEKAKMHRRYDPFILQQRGLSQVQAARFAELMMERARNREDVQAAVEQGGLKGDDPGVLALRRKLDEPIQRELREMLGPDGMAAYSDYEGTSSYRMGFIEPLRPMFVSAETPLTMEQEDRLVRIIMANVQTYRAKPTDLGSQRRFDWDAIKEQGKAVLTPAQQLVFQLQVDRWKAAIK